MSQAEDDVIQMVLDADSLVRKARAACFELSGKTMAFDDILRHLSMANQHLDAAHTIIAAIRRREPEG